MRQHEQLVRHHLFDSLTILVRMSALTMSGKTEIPSRRICKNRSIYDQFDALHHFPQGTHADGVWRIGCGGAETSNQAVENIYIRSRLIVFLGTSTKLTLVRCKDRQYQRIMHRLRRRR